MRTILAVSVTLLIGAVLYILSLREELSYYRGKFTYSEIDHERRMLVTRWKADDRVLEAFFDVNEDLEWDSLVVFSADQRPSTIWVDQDFNGIYEVSFLLNRKGDLVSRYEDIGQDGWWEEYERFTQDSTFLYRDANGDGYYATDEMFRSAKRTDR